VRALALAIVLTAAVTARAECQGPERVVRELEVGRRVRLDAAGLGRIEGRFLTLRGDLLAIDVEAQEREIRVREIQRLWVRGHSAKRGAVIGALVGGAAGVLGGLLIAEVACGPTDGGDCTTLEVASVFGLVAGGGGALLGAGIGLAIPSWKLRFPD